MIDRSRALGAYAGVVTLALIWVVAGGAIDRTAKFGTIDVERINVREPDGTLRMTVAGSKRMPGIIIEGRERPHPNRREAGMIFFNDEGTENGGLVLDGAKIDGKPTNAGSLTFDRWQQDQTLQLISTEDGAQRRSGLIITDRPDAPMNWDRLDQIRQMPAGPAKDAAYAEQARGVAQRAWLGRQVDGSSQLVLRDGAGKPRLRLSVGADGASSIAFLDAAGKVTRTIE